MDMQGIHLVALDVDGTLTDGKLVYGPNGVSQGFNAKDGAGIMTLLEHGIHVAFVSFRDFPCTRRRAADLGVKYLILGCGDKAAAISSLADHVGIPLSSVLFMGDDSRDIPALLAAGVAACPSDASDEVKRVCSFVARAPGGGGAVREVADAVLEAGSV